MSIIYDQLGEKSFFNQTIDGKPFARQLVDIGHPIIKIYKIIKNINHPQIIKIYKIHKIDEWTIAIDMEFFIPMLEEQSYYIFNSSELKKIKNAINELNKNRIILVKLTRENIAFVNPTTFKLYSFLDAGLRSINNPYKWTFKPFLFDIHKKRLRKCDFYSYLSDVYKLEKLDECAYEIFKKANKRRKMLIHSENIQMAYDEQIPWAA
jgi:hypothetical protein